MIRLDHTTRTSVLAALTFASAGTAQSPSDSGAFRAVPLALVLKDDATISSKPAGLPMPLTTFPAGNEDVPEFTIAAITNAIYAGASAPYTTKTLKLDGLSTGNDLMPMSWDAVDGFRFRIDPAATIWTTILTSVSEAATGIPAPPTNLINNLVPDPGPGAEILGYYVQSDITPKELNGQVFREQGAVDFNLGNRPEVVALDLFAPLIIARGAEPENRVMPTVDRVFVTFTQLSLDNSGLRLYWFGESNDELVTGASIITLEWAEINGAWGWYNPRIIADHTYFGLGAGTEIDALAVDFNSPRPSNFKLQPEKPVLLVSPQLPSTAAQLIVSALVDTGTSAGYIRKFGRPEVPTAIGVNPPTITIPQGIGLNIDEEIDAVCIADPESTLTETFASPVAEAPGAPVRDLSLSIYRTRTPGSVFCVVTGWGPGGPINSSVTVRFKYGSQDPSLPFNNSMNLPNHRLANMDSYDFTLPVPVANTSLPIHVYVEQITTDGEADTYRSYVVTFDAGPVWPND